MIVLYVAAIFSGVAGLGFLVSGIRALRDKDPDALKLVGTGLFLVGYTTGVVLGMVFTSTYN